MRAKGTVVLAWVIPIVILATIVNAIDEGGWIPHTKTLDMRMTGNWISNESRNCSVDMIYAKSDFSYHAQQVRCPNDQDSTETHTIPVKFWGRIKRPSVPISYWDGAHWAGGTMWRCKREEDAFTCYAVN